MYVRYHTWYLVHTYHTISIWIYNEGGGKQKPEYYEGEEEEVFFLRVKKERMIWVS